MIASSPFATIHPAPAWGASVPDLSWIVSWSVLAPQVLLSLAACLLILGGTTRLSKQFMGYFSLASLGIGAVLLSWTPRSILNTLGTDGTELTPLWLPVVADPLSLLFQWVALGIGGMFVLVSLTQDEKSAPSAEFHGLLMTMIVGLATTAAANDLIVLFLSLELISIPTYVLLFLGRKDSASQESALKYFLLSVVSAAVLLYGFSLLYGLTGSTNLSAIREILGAVQLSDQRSHLGTIACVLIIAGLAFKIAAVPFHFYAPDVYQGTTPFNAGLLAVVPKIAGFVALSRIVVLSLPGYEDVCQRLAVILAIATMTGGNILALLQNNIRRMLAYSSIAHSGYMLVGIATGCWISANGANGEDYLGGLPNGLQACLFYLIAYSIASVGLFAVLVHVDKKERPVEHVEDLTGLLRTHPWIAISAAIFLFSMAGIPPFPGFWGKLMLFGGSLSVVGGDALFPYTQKYFVVLAVVGMLNAAIGAVYYLRLIGVMFLHEPLTIHKGGEKGTWLVISIASMASLFLGLQVRPMIEEIREINYETTQIVAAPK